MLLGQLQVVGGVKLAHQHQRAAQRQRGQGGHQRGVGIQRRGTQRHRVGAVAVGHRPAHMGPAHGPGLHDALGHAGGARGIDHIERPVGLGRDRLGLHATVRQPSRPGRARFGDIVQRHTAQRGTRLQGPLAGDGAVTQHQARAAVVEHGAQVLGGGRRGQWRHRHPSPQGAQIGQHIFDGRAGTDGHHIARPQAVALQAGGHAVHTGAQRGVVQ